LPSLSGKVIKHLKPNTTLVGTFHTPALNGWLRTVNQLNARLTRSELQRFDQLFSVSEAARAAAKEIYGVDSEVLPCPVKVEQHHEADHANTENDRTVITFLGRLVARKGVDTFLDSITLLDPATKDKVQIRIVGDGNERKLAEQQVAISGLQSRTHFFGKVSDERKQELLGTSDIVAYPSNGGESFGIVLAEAMAVGKPIVLASDIDGYSEVLKQTPEALVTRNDPQALADRIRAIISNPVQRQALYAGQQEAVRRFDVSRTIGPKLLNAYGLTAGGSR
jgi:phosphatidylinositol alpha-mannosyltransferase